MTQDCTSRIYKSNHNHDGKGGMKTEYRNQLRRKQIQDQENQYSPLMILLKGTLTLIIFKQTN